jgi:hypothetical protein
MADIVDHERRWRADNQKNPEGKQRHKSPAGRAGGVFILLSDGSSQKLLRHADPF